MKSPYHKNPPQGQKCTSEKPHGVARVISKRGFCSRSKAEMLVREGRVEVNGKLVQNPEFPTYEKDQITINGKNVVANEFIYFMMNKPRGYVTTAHDEKGRPTVLDLFREQFEKKFPGKNMPHLSPVGRLDAATEGLLLFSNDTQWTNSMLIPGAHTKIYRVQIKGIISPEELKKLEKGFEVEPRIFGEPKEFMHMVSAKIHAEGEKNCWLEVVLDEGKNRQIRRMLAHLGYEVLRLIRIQFQDYKLGALKSGEIQVL